MIQRRRRFCFMDVSLLLGLGRDAPFEGQLKPDSCLRVTPRRAQSSSTKVTIMFTWYSVTRPASKRTCCSLTQAPRIFRNVRLALVRPCWIASSKLFDDERVPEREELRPPSEAACSDLRLPRESFERLPVARDERIPGLGSNRHGAEHETLSELCGEVFQAMHGGVNPSVEERVLDSLRERPLGIESHPEVPWVAFFAVRPDRDDSEADLGMAGPERGHDDLRLRDSKRASSGSDAERRRHCASSRNPNRLRTSRAYSLDAAPSAAFARMACVGS